MAFDERELRLGIFDEFEAAQEKAEHGGITPEEVTCFRVRQCRRIWAPARAPEPIRKRRRRRRRKARKRKRAQPHAPKPARARKSDPRGCPRCGAMSKTHRCAAYNRVIKFDPPKVRFFEEARQ